MSKNIQVGLIGFGVAGRVFHAPILTNVKGLHLIKIRETKPENIAIANARYPEADIVNEAKAIFDDSRIDLVVIATPNTSHLSLAKEALLAGKHVVVDKPFTITSADADELIELAKRQGKLLTVHHNRRWDSNAKTIKKIIDSKILGTLVEYEAHYDRFRNFFRKDAWREADIPGSGIWYDLGAHLVDEVQCLFGLPEEITADIRIQRLGGNAIDHFAVVFHYPQLKVTLKGGMLVKEPGPTCVLLGDQGSFVKYGMDVQEEALKAGLSPSDVANWGEEPESLWGQLNTEIQGMHIVGKVESEKGDYRGFYANVYKAILGEEELIVTPEQARNTIKMIELAIKSSEEKRTVKLT
ncbi:MAG: oxidoreductase [Bacteroidota bacterium]